MNSKIARAFMIPRGAGRFLVRFDDAALRIKILREDLEIELIKEKISEMMQEYSRPIPRYVGHFEALEIVSLRLYDLACEAKPMPWEKNES